MSKVSIIMPVYNAEKYIAEAIESVFCQSYENWELLIVNDGSTDHSPEIIDFYSQKDARIKAFHRKNEGVSMARNFALNQMSGAYVTFIDSDDVYHADRLKRMLQVFEQNPDCDIVFTRHIQFTGILKITGTSSPGKASIIDNNILRNVISDSMNHFICNTMIRASVARKEQFCPIRFAEDYCYIRDCACHCRQMAVLDDELYYYRRDNENAMTSHFFSDKYIQDYMMLVENTYQFCIDHHLEDLFYRNMVAHEYAQNSMRIRKCTTYSKFVTCMNDPQFRAGLKFAETSQCSFLERILFFWVKHKIYFPFALWHRQ